jgi:hypothetical protein
VTAQLARAVLGRLADVREHVIDRGGHWLHIAYPDTVAATILEFNDAVASRPAYPRHHHDFRVQISNVAALLPTRDSKRETSTSGGHIDANRHPHHLHRQGMGYPIVYQQN